MRINKQVDIHIYVYVEMVYMPIHVHTSVHTRTLYLSRVPGARMGEIVVLGQGPLSRGNAA